MNNQQYKQIRKQNNFLFTYYNKMGGVIRREAPFQNAFNTWCSSILGMPPQVKITIIKQELDKKYNYNE